MTIATASTRQVPSRSSKNDLNSCHTASTASNSSMSPPQDGIKKTGDRRRTRPSKSSGREMLMTLIAKEMTSTWLDEDTKVPQLGSPSPSGTMSAEELFYAQINGEAIDHLPGPEAEQSPSAFNESGDDMHFDGEGSFGALTIPDDVRAPPREREATRRSSLESGSKASNSKASTKGTKSSKASLSKKSTHSGTSRSSSEDTLSMEEIQKYVMENMPVEVRDKIPKEAWAQIFGKISPDKTRKPSKYSKPTEEEKVVEKEDDSSVISDITEFTEHYKGGAIDQSDRVLSPEEVEWDEEECPGLDNAAFNKTDNDTKSKSSSGSASLMVDATGEVKPVKGMSVSFANVQVRYYERILDINPAVTSGPAIGIGWRYKRGGSIPINEWEMHRGGDLRRSTELILPRPVREKMLQAAGYDQKQIAEAVRIIRKAKDRRKITVQNLGAGTEAVEETVEAASRRIKGILSFGRKNGILSSY